MQFKDFSLKAGRRATAKFLFSFSSSSSSSSDQKKLRCLDLGTAVQYNQDEDELFGRDGTGRDGGLPVSSAVPQRNSTQRCHPFHGNR